MGKNAIVLIVDVVTTLTTTVAQMQGHADLLTVETGKTTPTLGHCPDDRFFGPTMLPRKRYPPSITVLFIPGTPLIYRWSTIISHRLRSERKGVGGKSVENNIPRGRDSFSFGPAEQRSRPLYHCNPFDLGSPWVGNVYYHSFRLEPLDVDAVPAYQYPATWFLTSLGVRFAILPNKN